MEAIQNEEAQTGLSHEIRISSGIRPEEVEAVLELAAESGILPPDALMSVEEMAWESAYGDGTQTHTFLLAKNGSNAPVGVLCYGLIPYWNGNFEMYGIAVTEDMQRYGIGSALVNEMKKRAVQSQGRSIFLETGTGNDHEPERLFYEANGFFREPRYLKQFVPSQGCVVYRLDMGEDEGE